MRSLGWPSGDVVLFSLPGMEEGWDAAGAGGAGRVHSRACEAPVLPKRCPKPCWKWLARGDGDAWSCGAVASPSLLQRKGGSS